MANLGEKYGAAADRVALAHSLRMLLVVTIFPVAITLAGFHATEDYRPVVTPFNAIGLVELLAIAATAGAVAKIAQVPPGFMIWSLLASTLLTRLGFQFSSIPSWLTNPAQGLMGWPLGARVDRRLIT